MEVVEAIAVVILIIAILVLILYYLQNSPGTMQKIRNYVPANVDSPMNEFINEEEDIPSSNEDLSNLDESEEKEGIRKKIKVKLGDIDMSTFDTDAFSKKIDSFLDEKSDQLIKEWSLATTNDLDVLEKKFSDTANSVDDLEKKFKKFKKSSVKFREETESRLDDLDKRINSLENK